MARGGAPGALGGRRARRTGLSPGRDHLAHLRRAPPDAFLRRAGAAAGDGIQRFVGDVRALPYATLFPFADWLRDRPWNLVWVRWFAFFAFFPLLVSLVLGRNAGLDRAAWAGLAATVRQRSLALVAVGIGAMALVHGLYDVFSGGWLGLVLVIFSFLVFVGYTRSAEMLAEKVQRHAAAATG